MMLLKSGPFLIKAAGDLEQTQQDFVRECSERMAALEEQVRRMESREKSSARESSERVAALEEQVQSLESREKRSAR